MGAFGVALSRISAAESRASTTTSRTPVTFANCASISPNSIRKPRIFTWKSFRPRYSRLPSVRQRARSPVLYSRPPATNGSSMNRSRVSSGRFKYPRATPAPPTYSSPVTPIGTGSRRSSSTYSCKSGIRTPIGLAPKRMASSARSAQYVTCTVVSVIPYMFTNCVRSP
ncbi:ATP-dependent Clp protease adaptor ClpS domain protein [Burkholderia pseudomallei]|nr:ATP-dependent Clp protease adaptor ClpS domain protein [Burkholderia pseudomallei]